MRDGHTKEFNMTATDILLFIIAEELFIGFSVGISIKLIQLHKEGKF